MSKKGRAPSVRDLKAVARRNNFSLTKEESRVFRERMKDMLSSYDKIGELARGLNVAPIRDRVGYYPPKKENPYGAWAWKCSIRHQVPKENKLFGKRVAIKDNILVAGVPLRNGSPMLARFIPSVDATVVTRILENGGEIAGKSTCEDLCTSGGSHTSYPKLVKNPRNPDYMAGGSSSGSAALLAAGEVEMALGGDQGGSIRIPSSWCGVYGLKPTLGLVPFTGILGMEPVLDHVGPMANTVEDVALLLEAIAGSDGLDPRQLNTPQRLPGYVDELREGFKIGLKIALVNEGFGWDGISEPDVDSRVEDSAYVFERLGAKIDRVSIPIHREGIHVWAGIVQDGVWNHVVRDHGLEHLWAGEYDVSLIEQWSRALEDHGDKLSESAKLIAIAGDYISNKFNGRYYALAHNLRRKLILAYDKVFQDHDLLVMPTTPNKARPLRSKGDLEWSIGATTGNLNNTCTFDVSGHPAMNVPCDSGNDLPIGMMLVGKYYDEVTILRAALGFSREHP